MSNSRIIVACDDPLTMKGLLALLEPDFNIIATVGDGMQLVSTAVEREPDAVVLDISLPVWDGFEAAKHLKTCVPKVKIIFVAMQSSPAQVALAIHSGASAYVLLRYAVTELGKAISLALKGHSYFSPVARETSTVKESHSIAAHADRLTDREIQVLQLVTAGLSAKDVASVLSISRRTAEFHKRRIMEKLGIRTSADMIRIAILEHLIDV